MFLRQFARTNATFVRQCQRHVIATAIIIRTDAKNGQKLTRRLPKILLIFSPRDNRVRAATVVVTATATALLLSLLLVQLALIRTHKRHQLSTEHWCHSFEFMRVRFDRQSHSLAPRVQIFRVFLCLSPTSKFATSHKCARFLPPRVSPVPFDIAREKLCDDCLRRKPSEKHGSRAHRYEHRSVAQSPPKWKHNQRDTNGFQNRMEEKEDGVSIRRAHRRRSRRVQRSEDDAVREVGVRGEKECAAEEVFRRRWEEMLRRRRHFCEEFSLQKL